MCVFQISISRGDERDDHLIFYSATLINPPTPTPTGPSQEDIRKVIADYKAREAKKATSDKEKEKEKPDDSREPPPEPLVKSTSPKPISTPPAGSTSTPAPGSGHRKYALHRQIFEMRQNDIKRKEMGMKAREVGKGESESVSAFEPLSQNGLSAGNGMRLGHS